MSHRQPQLLLVIAAILAAGAAGTFAQQFRSRVDLVRLPVVVNDRAGKLVRGLTVDDFEVLEDGQRQTIAYFAEGAPGEQLPLHLGLLLDGSGSMEKDLRAASAAAVKFVQSLEEAIDVTFVDFDTSVRLGRFSPPSYPQLFERIRDRKAEGWTALYDALGVYLESALARDGQHVLLIYSDGGDTRSQMTFGKLQELLRIANVIVYSIGYLDNQLHSARAPQQMRMTQIARETGGDAFFPATGQKLDDVYSKILDELAARYTIGYVPATLKTDGKFRRVEVRVTRPDLRGARVRTRTGYMSPAAR